ncbi:hypothetical protein P3S67_028037 [Capsicum chacoense]
MANFFTDTKKKIQDLFVCIVSCGKSSKEPGNDQQGNAPENAEAGYAPIVPIIVDEPRNPQVNYEPIVPISDVQGDANVQQDFAIFPPGDERNNLIYKPEDNNGDDNNTNNNNGRLVKPVGQVFTSKPSGKRSAPIFQTG